jgi:enoyl-CoA hydratase/carnithine racemase
MLTYTVEDSIAWAALDRPEKLNAMTDGFWAELVEVLDRAEADPDVRALVFHGNGRCFSVGGDIAGFGELRDSGDRREYVRRALHALRAVERLSKPTIAAVHGMAMGGGCELTFVCDIVVCDETAKFGTPESRVGLVPGLGVVRGGASVNMHWLKYMVLTGEPLDAEEARLAGLVNRVTPAGEHLDEARRLARICAERAPLALAVGKEVVGRHADEGYGQGIEAVSYLMGTADQAEGIAAFVEKREPRFEGR